MVVVLVCLLIENKSINLSTIIKISTFQLSFVWKISEKFDAVESREVSFKGNMNNFTIDSNVIDKSGILSIHKYLGVKNNRN